MDSFRIRGWAGMRPQSSWIGTTNVTWALPLRGKSESNTLSPVYPFLKCRMFLSRGSVKRAALRHWRSARNPRGMTILTP